MRRSMVCIVGGADHGYFLWMKTAVFDNSLTSEFLVSGADRRYFSLGRRFESGSVARPEAQMGRAKDKPVLLSPVPSLQFVDSEEFSYFVTTIAGSNPAQHLLGADGGIGRRISEFDSPSALY
ncbi:hypothetical protein [Asticcacaulis sp. AC466]|uniref:hypothetical protein n=1 Tax=Asticcacaulis sp. AC466 TaxID=1282362 RepID=UPI00138B0C17|nr:hypothetical protein [Asticcacaulis sp. AC466]